jgi:hypothetical protein
MRQNLMHKIKLVLALIFQLRFDYAITHFTEQLFNTIIEYHEHQNKKADLIFQA